MEADYKARTDRLAKIIWGLIEGDDPDDACDALKEFGYMDDDGFPKWEQE